VKVVRLDARSRELIGLRRVSNTTAMLAPQGNYKSQPETRYMM